MNTTLNAKKPLYIDSRGEIKQKRIHTTHIAILLGAVAMIASGFAVFTSLRTQTVAYVRSGELISNYVGMKEAQNELRLKTEGWQSNIDTLGADYSRALNEFNRNIANLSPAEKSERRDYLRQQQLNLEQYTAAIRERAKEEETKISQGVLNQINSFVADYGRKHGYNVILGTTNSGNLLYGDDDLDLTRNILQELNLSYRKKPDGK